MSIAFLYNENGFNLAIFGLTAAFVLVGIAIRLSRQGSDAFDGMMVFTGVKLAEGFFVAMALVALLAVVDGLVAARLAHHSAYAVLALIGGAVASIDLLIDD